MAIPLQKTMRFVPISETGPSRTLYPDTTPSTPRLTGSITSSAVKARDRICTMCKENWSLTSAHIIPRAEIEWVRIVGS